MSALLARRFPNAEIEAFDLLHSPIMIKTLDDRCLTRKIKFDLICSKRSLEMVTSLPSLLPMLVEWSRRAGASQLNFPTICTSQAAR